MIFPMLVAACNSSDLSSLSTVSTVEGDDHSGTYRNIGVECYDSSQSLSALAGYSSSSPVGTLIISGNSTESTTVSSSCTARARGRAVFTRQGSGSGYTYGSVTLTTTSMTTSSSSCSFTQTFVPVSGSPSISPGSINMSYSSSTSTGSVTGDYIHNDSGYIALLTALQVSGYPSDLCFYIFDRI